MIRLKDYIKVIIGTALDAAAVVVLTLAEQFSWDLPWWGVLTTLLVFVLGTFLDITWVPPEKKE